MWMGLKRGQPECVDGVKIGHLVEGKDSRGKPCDQQLRWLVHGRACDPAILLWEQVSGERTIWRERARGKHFNKDHKLFASVQYSTLLQ